MFSSNFNLPLAILLSCGLSLSYATDINSNDLLQFQGVVQCSSQKPGDIIHVGHYASNKEVYLVVDDSDTPRGIRYNQTLKALRTGQPFYVRNDTGVTEVEKICTSHVTNMKNLLEGARSLKDISDWDTSNVTDMSSMFHVAAEFNQDIGSWDVSKVINMSQMFRAANRFNQNIGDWDTSNVEYMQDMFFAALSFNQNISHWNTSKVKDMEGMFRNDLYFNQNLSDWNTSKVDNMTEMFLDSVSYNQNMSDWNVKNVNNCSSFAVGSQLTYNNMPKFNSCL